MPVWHERTRALRESGEIAVVGIVQEQHPDRALLFARWQGFDWPILWDPFGLTGSAVVPSVVLADEHGVVRGAPSDLEELRGLLAREHAAPEALPAAAEAGPERLAGLDDPPADDLERAHLEALSDLLWRRDGRIDAAVETLERHAREHPGDAALRFRAGVARRMRWDSPGARPGDFQAALDHWTRALDLVPNQYVWRRRIQQYGPRTDKPYPFYAWVDEARAALAARGEDPPELAARPTPSELAERRSFEPGGEAEPPDLDGRIARDEDGLVSVEAAVARDTSGEGRVAAVHLSLRPDAGRDVHWANDAGPLVVWLGDPDLPQGWRASERRLEAAGPEGLDASAESRLLSVDLELPADAGDAPLRGYALYYVCEGVGGECLYLRRDFEVPLRAPGSD